MVEQIVLRNDADAPVYETTDYRYRDFDCSAEEIYEVVGSVFSRADLVVVLCVGVESARGVVEV